MDHVKQNVVNWNKERAVMASKTAVQYDKEGNEEAALKHRREASRFLYNIKQLKVDE